MKVLILALVCTFLWGAGYPVVKISYKYFEIAASDVASKMLFAGIRFSIAGIITFLISTTREKKLVLPKKHNYLPILLLAVFQTVLQYTFTYIGLANTESAKSSVLNQINVFLLVLLTPLVLKGEKLTVGKIVGCIIGFVGIVIINLSGMSLSFNLGDGAIVMASVTAAIGYLISKLVATDESAFTVTAFQQFAGGIILMIIGFVFGGHIDTVNIYGILCLAFLSIAASLAYSIWVTLVRENDVSSVSIYKFLTPIFGIVCSYILLGENIFKIENLIALVFVCAGIILVNLKTNKKADTLK